MRKIKLTSDMVRRIEDALEERKGQRRAQPQAADTERRSRADRRGATPAADDATPAGKG